MLDYELNESKTRLTLRVDDCEAFAEFVHERADELDADATLADACEALLANSSLDWIAPDELGDLTAAPMLGERDSGGRVVSRWAFMDYQIKSVLAELRDNGRAEFVGEAFDDCEADD